MTKQSKIPTKLKRTELITENYYKFLVTLKNKVSTNSKVLNKLKITSTGNPKLYQQILFHQMSSQLHEYQEEHNWDIKIVILSIATVIKCVILTLPLF
jgi:hypothetical protein